MPFQLCYITDRRLLGPGRLLPWIAEAARAGVNIVQIREKDLATRPLLDLVKGAIEGTGGTDTQVVVNDRLDIALALGAAGVHLGTRSLPAHVVRNCVPPGFLVGVSCHSLDDALAAEEARADYILLGPIFETHSKLAYGPPLGLDKLKEVSARIHTSVLALGGITLERVRPCLDAGASGIAGISLFQTCASLPRLVQDLKLIFGGPED